MIDPITTAIIAALANLSKDAIKDGYGALKAALKKKFGAESDLVDAVDLTSFMIIDELPSYYSIAVLSLMKYKFKLSQKR